MFLFLSACSSFSPSLREKNPEELFRQLCSIGEQIDSSRGSVWFRTESSQVHGQYFADVLVSPKNLTVEVTNLFGGSEALIRVHEDHYEVKRGGKVVGSEGSWGGIPLRWASDLFLGKIPCPLQPSHLYFGAENDQLIAESSDETFVYRLEEKDRKVWPKSLVWTKAGSEPVKFSFEDAEQESRSPLKWEITSPQGLLKLRWRNRQPVFSREIKNHRN